MTFDKKIDITKEFIFSKLDDWSIYKWYLPGIDLHKDVKVPWRQDRSPSLAIFPMDGKILWRDKGRSETGNSIQLVGKMFGVNYDKALRKVALDFDLVSGNDDYKQITSKYSKPILQENYQCRIQCKVMPFTEAHRTYWAQYHISEEECKREYIYAVKEVFINRRKVVLDKNEICFGYFFEGGLGWKILFPQRGAIDKKQKWKSNISLTIVENINAINNKNKILLTKSRKDRIFLSRLLPEYAVISVQNESISFCTQEFIEKLKGKKIYINFDNDPPGKEASIKVNALLPGSSHLNVPDKYLPTITDFTDLAKEYGEKEVIKYLIYKGLLS